MHDAPNRPRGERLTLDAGPARIFCQAFGGRPDLAPYARSSVEAVGPAHNLGRPSRTGVEARTVTANVTSAGVTSFAVV